MLSEELSNYLIETKGQIFVPAFNREVSLSIDEKCSLEYVEKVVEYVKDMPSRLINELCKGATDFFRSYLIVYQNKKNVNDIYFDFTMPLDTNGIDILNYIFPQVLRIDQPLTNEIGFAFQCECEWEPEHGMEWVVRNGETLSISWFDGLTPWDDEKNFEHYNFGEGVIKWE